MAQSDQVVQNATFPSVRTDINDNLAALYSQSSGNSAPTVTVAFQPWIDSSSSPPVWKVRNGSNSAWITIGILDPAGFSASGIPIGQIIYAATSSTPTGYLKCNGAAISRTTYANLFAAIGTTFGVGDGSTTFTLPDLRGEFLRAWADGRSVDTGRALGSFQDQAYLSHTHGVNDPGHAHGVYDPGHAHGYQYTDINSRRYVATGDTDYPVEGSSGGGNTTTSVEGTGIGIYGSGTGISIQSNGGSETRPRNIALLACIKF